MLVIIESPYVGDIQVNLQYVRAAMRHCLLRGEAPFASHAIYTQRGVLDDNEHTERELGIQAGFRWREAADLTCFYTDLGWSRGMRAGLQHCLNTMTPYVERSLPDWHAYAARMRTFHNMLTVEELEPPSPQTLRSK